MKRITLKSSLAAGLTTLLLLFPNFRKGTLKDIAKPYLGVYECTEAKLDDVDYLDRFSYINLELKTCEDFILHYSEKDGKKKQETGKYRYDKEKGTITLTGAAGAFKREFPLKEGILNISMRIGDKMLSLKFEQK